MSEHIYEFKVKDFNTLVKMWLAGNGTFYFKNLETGNELTIVMKTYINERNKNQPTFIEACLLHRPITSAVDRKIQKRKTISIAKVYLKLGTIHVLEDQYIKSYHEKLVKSFKYVHNCIVTGRGLADEISVWYNGHCCRCKKELSVTESIEQGFGDECKEYFKNSTPSVQFKTGL